MYSPRYSYLLYSLNNSPKLQNSSRITSRLGIGGIRQGQMDMSTIYRLRDESIARSQQAFRTIRYSYQTGGRQHTPSYRSYYSPRVSAYSGIGYTDPSGRDERQGTGIVARLLGEYVSQDSSTAQPAPSEDAAQTTSQSPKTKKQATTTDSACKPFEEKKTDDDRGEGGAAGEIVTTPTELVDKQDIATCVTTDEEAYETTSSETGLPASKATSSDEESSEERQARALVRPSFRSARESTSSSSSDLSPDSSPSTSRKKLSPLQRMRALSASLLSLVSVNPFEDYDVSQVDSTLPKSFYGIVKKQISALEYCLQDGSDFSFLNPENYAKFDLIYCQVVQMSFYKNKKFNPLKGKVSQLLQQLKARHPEEFAQAKASFDIASLK